MPKAGTYQVPYSGRVPGGGVGKTLRLTVGGATYNTTIPASSTMHTVTGPSVTFSQVGTHTIQISAPAPGNGGWQLDRITFTRS